MKAIASFYLGMYIISIIIEPFLFGEERKPYSPSSWAFRTIVFSPMLWLLLQVIYNN